MRSRTLAPICLVAIFAATSCVLAKDISREDANPGKLLAEARAASVQKFERQIKPLFEKHCFDCHGSDLQEGDLALSELDPAMLAASDAERWHEALNRINLGEMPPDYQEQPSDEERQVLVDWLTESLDLARKSAQGSPNSVIRRLTKEQYSHTLADLLGLPIEFGDSLPADPKSEMGFTNGGETLSMSTLQAEYYQAIARKALDKAIRYGERPPLKRYRATVGLDIGTGHHAAAIGGYQSGPIPSDHVRVEILDEQGQPREGETSAEITALRKIESNIGIGMRGSSSDRYRVLDRGLLLLSALPHKERVPKSWQGPSPNMKMLVRRIYPREGPFVTRVVASRATPEDYDFQEGLTSLRTDEPMAKLPDVMPVQPVGPKGGLEEIAASEIQPKPQTQGDALVLTVDDCAWTNKMVRRGRALVPEDITKPSYAGFELELPRESYYQIDLVHPAATGDAMPSVSIEIGDSDQHLRLEPSGVSPEQLVVTPLAHAHFRAGQRTLRIGGKFFVGFSHVVLTPLADDHPAAEQLRRELDEGLKRERSDRAAALRAFIGTRTDDGMEYAEYDEPKVIDTPQGEWRTYEFYGQLENLPVPIYDETEKSDLSNIMLVGLWNDHLVKSNSERGVPIVVRSIEIEAPYYPVWPPESYTNVFFDSSLRESDRDKYTRELLSRFMRRAFRREVPVAEVERYFDFWQAIRADYSQYEEGVKETLVAILCSPRFLYLASPSEQKIAEASPAVAPVNDLHLAERLSYFLWNSPPDAELIHLAEAGKLSEQLTPQSRRMLADSRSERFVRSFCWQWLRLDRQQAMSINVETYPDYTRFVKRDMQLETLKFFEHVLDENLSLLTLIDSDFAMLNQNLAEFYGIKGVEGVHFRPVPVSPGEHRGGLLSQGAFLTGHSDGTQSHPIKRAVWLKEKILGSPPPPPPPNVPELDPETPGFEKLTLKEQLELHRSKASCVDCHRKIDPYGVVFENYDAVGRFRTEAKGKPIDARSELPDGTVIDGVAALKSHILQERPDEFARSLVKHLLAYSLGRDLTFADEPEIDRIVQRVRDHNYRLQSVIMEIVKSEVFRGS